MNKLVFFICNPANCDAYNLGYFNIIINVTPQYGSRKVIEDVQIQLQDCAVSQRKEPQCETLQFGV